MSLASAFCPVGGGLHPLWDLLPQPSGLDSKIKDGLEPALEFAVHASNLPSTNGMVLAFALPSGHTVTTTNPCCQSG